MSRHDQTDWIFNCTICGVRLLSARGVWCADCRRDVHDLLDPKEEK